VNQKPNNRVFFTGVRCQLSLKECTIIIEFLDSNV
jgi:hypothetical protein